MITSSADTATRRVLDLMLRNGEPLVVAESPPGAGKTTLVEAVATTAASHVGLRVAVVAPRAEQTYDVARRLVAHYPTVVVQMLQSARRDVPPHLAADLHFPRPVSDVGLLAPGPGVVVGTVDKFAFSVPDFVAPSFDLVICDEADQFTYKAFAPLFHLAPQVLLVGDPGQLPPLVRVDTARFEGARYKVHWPLAKELRRRFPDVPTVTLPASRRLPQDTVDLVQPSLYRSLPFVSAARAGDRRLSYGHAGTGSPADRALDLLASGATVVGLVLPARDLVAAEVDEEVAALAAEVGRRLLERRVAWIGRRPLAACDVGIVDPHVASEAAIRRHLRRHGISTDEMMVGTPEVWQGLERPLVIAKYPLSGLSRLDPFALELGRLSVMVSRHLLGCILVGRDGVAQALRGYRHDCAERPMGAEDAAWEGWRAHTTLWDQLEQAGRIVRI